MNMHFHANTRTGFDRPTSLGTFNSRQGAGAALLQSIGRRLQETGWVVEDYALPATGLGNVRLYNLQTREVVSSSVWACGCATGERDVEGLAAYPPARSA